METLTLDVELRVKTGKGVARKLRMAEKMPAVLNRAGSTIPLELEKKPMLKLINSHKSKHTLLTLNVSNASENQSRTAIVNEFQTHPVTGELIHIDFKEIRMDEKISITVPINLTGTAKGVAKEGGIMQVLKRTLTLECMPGDIVDSIEFDITNVNANTSIHASDMTLPPNIELKTSPVTVILAISAPRAAETAYEETTAPAEASAPEKSGEDKSAT